MRPVQHHALCLAMRPQGARHGRTEINDKMVAERRGPWAPCEQFVRRNAPWAAAVLLPVAETLDYSIDFITDRGIFWDLERQAIVRRIGTYEEILEAWYYGKTPKERLKALNAFSVSTVYASWGDQAPALDIQSVYFCNNVPGYFEKYFDGHVGVDASLVDLLRDAVKCRVMSPVSLQTMRLVVDRIIGPQKNLAAAKITVKRLLVRAHPDRYQNLPMQDDGMLRAARRIFDAVMLVREMVNDPQYGPALYAPRRLERGQGLGWRLGIVVGVVGFAAFYAGVAVLEGARRCLTAMRTWLRPLTASAPTQRRESLSPCPSTGP